MKITCECGHGFTTSDHENTVSFAAEGVVGALGPDEVRSDLHISAAHGCPSCGKGRYVVIALNATRFTPTERRELETLLLRLAQGHSPR